MPDLDIKLIQKRFENSKQLVDTKIADFQRWEDWKKCVLPKELRVMFSGEYKHRSALVPPIVRTCLKSLEARIVDSLFSVNPHFDLVSDLYPEEILDKNLKLLQIQFEAFNINPKARYRWKITKQVSDWLTYGIGVKELVPLTIKDLEGEIVYEGPTWKTVSPYKFYPCSYTDTEGNLPYYFIQSVVFYRDLLDNPLFDEEIVKNIPLSKYGEIKSRVQHYATGVNFDQLNLTNESEKAICPVLIWIYRDKDEIVTVANESYELKRAENPFKIPGLGLSILNLGDDDEEFYGLSSVDVIEDNVIEKFHKRNQRLDESNLSIGSQWLSDDPSAPPLFHSISGKVHKVGTGRLNNYIPLQFNGKADLGFAEEQLVTKEIKEALNLTDQFMGLSPERRETATVGLILNQNASTPMTHTIKQIEDMVIIQDIKTMLAWNSKFFPTIPPPIYRHLGITREQVVQDVGIRALGISQAISRPVLASQYTGFMEQWKTIPILAENVDWLELAQRQLQTLVIPDPDKIIIDPATKLIPVTKENYLINQGIPIPVDPREPHELHLKYHDFFQNSPEFNPQFSDLMEQHKAEHEQFYQMQMPPTRGGGAGKIAPVNAREEIKRQSGEMQLQGQEIV